MGCGCGGGRRGAPRQFRKRVYTPNVGPKSIEGGSAAGPSPIQLRALGLQQSVSVTETKRLDEDRRRMEKLRRDAIRKRLGR